MTKLPYTIPEFNRATIGFDRLFDAMEKQFGNSVQMNGYPPYNIVQLNEDEYVISLAVAGFGMENLEITREKNVLRIEGIPPKNDEDIKYLHKGVGNRKFRKEFTLADYVEVKNASLDLGMLNVYLKREVPENAHPIKISITKQNTL